MSSPPPDDRPAATIRVATWNVWWRFGPWQQRQPAIAATLAEAGPDIVCLQETWSEGTESQAEQLAGALGWTDYAVAGGDAGSEVSFDNALLSRWPLVDTHTVALPRGDGQHGHRTALFSTVDSPAGPILCASTHLAYRFDESALRRAQLDAICSHVAESRAAPETSFPPVVCGDLNAVPSSDEIRSLTGESAPTVPGLVFTDAWAAVGVGPGHTWDVANPYQADTSWPRRRLDYVMVGWPRPRPLGNPERAQLLGDAPVDGVWPSDHLGVMVDLSTRRPAPAD